MSSKEYAAFVLLGATVGGVITALALWEPIAAGIAASAIAGLCVIGGMLWQGYRDLRQL